MQMRAFMFTYTQHRADISLQLVWHLNHLQIFLNRVTHLLNFKIKTYLKDLKKV